MDARWAITTIVTVLLALSTTCYNLGSRVGTVEGKLEEGLKGINQRFTDFDGQVGQINRANKDLDSIVRRLEVSVGVLERDAKRLEAGTGALAGLEGRLAGLQADHKALQGSLDRPRYDDQLKRIEDRLNELASKLQAPKGVS